MSEATAAPAEASDTITLRVVDAAKEEMFFKVKKGTKMSKISEAYASKKGIATSAFRFMFDGQRIQGDQTPKMLEMDDDDQIDVHLETIGGQ